MSTLKNSGFGVVCRHCQRTLGQPFCAYCKTYAMRCIICQMPVRGLSSFCLACGHGGHSEHIREWFAIESVCPTGCGCSCTEQLFSLFSTPSLPLCRCKNTHLFCF
jgi:hypothetical protein